MSAFTCLTCRDLPGVAVEALSPDAADEHEGRGHDVRRLPDEWERRTGRDPEYAAIERQTPRGRRERALDGQGPPRGDY